MGVDCVVSMHVIAKWSEGLSPSLYVDVIYVLMTQVLARYLAAVFNSRINVQPRQFSLKQTECARQTRSVIYCRSDSTERKLFCMLNGTQLRSNVTKADIGTASSNGTCQ